MNSEPKASDSEAPEKNTSSNSKTGDSEVLKNNLNLDAPEGSVKVKPSPAELEVMKAVVYHEKLEMVDSKKIVPRPTVGQTFQKRKVPIIFTGMLGLVFAIAGAICFFVSTKIPDNNSSWIMYSQGLPTSEKQCF